MKQSILPRLAERVFAVRAAWRQQVPLRIRVESVRSVAGGETAIAPSTGGPPVRRVARSEVDSQVA